MLINGMNYDWTKILAPDETLEKEFGVSPFYIQCVFILAIVVAVIVMFGQVFAGIFVLLLGVLYCYYLKKAKHYAFTKKRMILVDSFLGENITSVDYTQITDVTVEQSLFDELGKWGTIIINTAGTNASSMRLSFIANPQDVKKTLDMIRDTNVTKVEVVQAPNSV